ncbi:hypothetical protein [Burkholderia multivorans]|uniref:hypothetical protein n=1 Tax=Burkholderia multivorans TaxID=87883 RepID=UPI0015E2B8F6|nr:hypothetical protein [Burkholderia multivorans]
MHQRPGRFARPQSSQQIGALPTCRPGGGSRQSIAEIAGAGSGVAAAWMAAAAAVMPPLRVSTSGMPTFVVAPSPLVRFTTSAVYARRRPQRAGVGHV